MDISEAEKILEGLSNEQLGALEDAHWRYMYFAGISTNDEASDKQAEADRITYAHLLKYTKDGRPSISDESTAEFMAAVSGLPHEWCLAWDERDFYVTHGVTFDEAARLGTI